MNAVFIILLFILLLIYEKVWRPVICKKKINYLINNFGGHIQSIKKITPRDEIYSVYYTVNGQAKHLNIKFNLFYKTTCE
jgi:hypothetical protein